ncbi:hypothetical protein DFH06DRAFT_190283 [Mycena polygramma]|nr:hypothetical protein DFH06DRAFT_190283 [Mycena polygramma]
MAICCLLFPFPFLLLLCLFCAGSRSPRMRSMPGLSWRDIFMRRPSFGSRAAFWRSWIRGGCSCIPSSYFPPMCMISLALGGAFGLPSSHNSTLLRAPYAPHSGVPLLLSRVRRAPPVSLRGRVFTVMSAGVFRLVSKPCLRFLPPRVLAGSWAETHSCATRHSAAIVGFRPNRSFLALQMLHQSK